MQNLYILYMYVFPSYRIQSPANECTRAALIQLGRGKVQTGQLHRTDSLVVKLKRYRNLEQGDIIGIVVVRIVELMLDDPLHGHHIGSTGTDIGYTKLHWELASTASSGAMRCCHHKLLGDDRATAGVRTSWAAQRDLQRETLNPLSLSVSQWSLYTHHKRIVLHTGVGTIYDTSHWRRSRHTETAQCQQQESAGVQFHYSHIVSWPNLTSWLVAGQEIAPSYTTLAIARSCPIRLWIYDSRYAGYKY